MISRGGIESTGTGDRFGTFTWNVCVAARPPGSVAVTIAVTVPFATATTVTTAPSTDTAKRLESDTAAE